MNLTARVESCGLVVGILDEHLDADIARQVMTRVSRIPASEVEDHA